MGSSRRGIAATAAAAVFAVAGAGRRRHGRPRSTARTPADAVGRRLRATSRRHVPRPQPSARTWGSGRAARLEAGHAGYPGDSRPLAVAVPRVDGRRRSAGARAGTALRPGRLVPVFTHPRVTRTGDPRGSRGLRGRGAVGLLRPRPAAPARRGPGHPGRRPGRGLRGGRRTSLSQGPLPDPACVRRSTMPACDCSPAAAGSTAPPATMSTTSSSSPPSSAPAHPNRRRRRLPVGPALAAAGDYREQSSDRGR